ncbi:Glycosyltransferase family 92 protein [Aphelenchoides besseyi]|nr:Glycosyltransferase family 92 protein [Aphelenchoides besseyi]
MRSKSTTPTHLFVAAAFHAREREWSTKLLIRMLVLADNTHINRELECTSFDQKVVAKVELLERKKGVGCRWRSFFVDCAFSNPRIDKFNLTLRHDALKHTIDVQKAGHRHHSLVVCYSRAFRLERWQSVISAIHFYSYQQVDFLDIRLASAVDSVYELLRAYEAEGRIQLRPALILPSLSDLIDYDANEEVDVYHQTLNYDACLYEHREMADFIIFADFDDLLHGPILKELKRLTANYPLAASFEFAWPPAAILDVKEPAKFELKSFVESLTWSSTGVDLPLYGKSVVRPLRIRHSFVHRPLLPEVQLVNRFEHHYLPNSSIVFVHARHFVEQEFFDSNDLKHAQRSRVNFTALTDDFLRFLNLVSSITNFFSLLRCNSRVFGTTTAIVF